MEHWKRFVTGTASRILEREEHILLAGGDQEVPLGKRLAAGCVVECVAFVLPSAGKYSAGASVLCFVECEAQLAERHVGRHGDTASAAETVCYCVSELSSLGWLPPARRGLIHEP